MSPPYHLRRISFLWLPLFVAGSFFIALAPFYAGAWAIIPFTLTGCAILAELTEHPTT